MCGKWKITEKKKRSFYGKNISDRKLFLPAALSGGAGPSGGYGKFAVEKESTDYTYTITIVDILPEAEGELLVNRVDLQVFRNGEGLESRLIGVKGEERPYALYRETAQKHAQVFVGRWYLDGVAKYEVVFLSLLALERRLSERPCLILHCAYLEYQGKAMLFSAPSGTGKTTQAGLWEQYRGKPYCKR